jgi:hypothetical protein
MEVADRKATKPPALDFDSLAGFLRGYMETLPDNRRGYNKQYSIDDAALSAFSMFFMQCPSFLEHQRQMGKRSGKDNVQSLFHARAIPSDNQIRNILDPISPRAMTPVFDRVFDKLQEEGHLEKYASVNNTLLIAMDATRYFSSSCISCEKCQQTHHSKGGITYSHSVITPVITAPDNPHVICLAPEFIHIQDGDTKQDSEHNAAKRWLKAHAHRYKSLGITLLGDDLYAHQPFIKMLQEEGFHYIFTCKTDSHKSLYRRVNIAEHFDNVKSFMKDRRHGKKHFIDTYRFVNNVKLHDGDDSINVNWCEITTTNENGEVTFFTALITDHHITEENCAEIIAAGRTRWKIENEQFNTLKTKGYNLEHNFGHGDEYLSEILFTFNLLAFLYHTILNLSDESYQAIRKELGTRKTFFQHVRTLTYYQYFENWQTLMEFMVVGLEIELANNTN